MLRRITMALAFTAAAGAAQAQQLSLDEISDYLNSFSQAQSGFTQINSDGTISTGTISIKRPGKARFEYNPPDEALVLASAGSIAVFDQKLGTQPERYPLNRTPLKIILARTVDLNEAKMVVGHSYDGVATTVVAQDPKNPELGTIEMIFTGQPVELRQWVITDDVGTETTLILGGLETDVSLHNDLFAIETSE